MKDMGVVQGSNIQARNIIIGTDTVYVHTNIQPIEIDIEGNKTNGLFQYNEIQYGKDEYIEIIASENKQLKTELTNVQVALVEIYESMGV